MNASMNSSSGARDYMLDGSEHLVMLVLIVVVNSLLLGLLIPSRLARCAKNSYYGYYLASMSGANILFAIVVLPVAYSSRYSKEWIFGGFLCKLTYNLDTVAVAVYVATLLALTVERQQAVVHPIKYRRVRSETKLCLYAIWSIAIFFAAPRLVLFYVFDKQGPSNWQCQRLNQDYPYHRIYNALLFSLMNMFPLLAIMACYCSTKYALNRAPRRTALSLKRSRLNRRFSNFILLLTTAFLLSTFPEWFFRHLLDIHRYNMHPDRVEDILRLLHLVSHLNKVVGPLLFIAAYWNDFSKTAVKAKRQMLLTTEICRDMNLLCCVPRKGAHKKGNLVEMYQRSRKDVNPRKYSSELNRAKIPHASQQAFTVQSGEDALRTCAKAEICQLPCCKHDAFGSRSRAHSFRKSIVRKHPLGESFMNKHVDQRGHHH